MFSVTVPVSFRRWGSSRLFFPELPGSTLPRSSCPCCDTLLLQGPCNPGSAGWVFSCMLPTRCTNKKFYRLCKSGWFSKWQLLWAVTCVGFYEPVLEKPGTGFLTLPNLYHFELLRTFLRKAATLEDGNMFSDSPVNGGKKFECLSKVII